MALMWCHCNKHVQGHYNLLWDITEPNIQQILHFIEAITFDKPIYIISKLCWSTIIIYKIKIIYINEQNYVVNHIS